MPSVLTVIGIAQISGNLDRALKNARRGGALGLTQHATEVLSNAIPRTPVETGALRRSGLVTEAKESRLESFTSYGQEGVRNDRTGIPTARYAVRVHEDPEEVRRTGMSKFLEITVNESEDEMLDNLAKPMSKRLDEGVG